MAKPRRKARQERTVALCFYIRPKVRALLETIKERDGIPYTAQLERAIVMWAREKGIDTTEAA